eukprot:CAMPEP_0184682002 /NCGR_PEP_ID=MMETSP0312-20130426/5291_1 /TAXON_ID=31354 /ORGANISM="Compsopogon coeruleus, Strain SAG 36.94" /LENGTH=1014 /DNA_ID=CAMNT_0027133223 /DNA_START=187 /DNA_END=3232 /DNA_ORIENTATION=-
MEAPIGASGSGLPMVLYVDGPATGVPKVQDRKIGEVVSGFELVRDELVEEISSAARLWRHQTTGTELLSMINSDENKTFGIVFRTPPSDSTGVPHILEHSVLCGSRKYPVKEPFVELIKASLNTFLNAFTYPDKTCYPVASCNEKDFYNLVDVYMDAVFHPRLTPDTLRQEGHHIEAESVEGEKSIKGVVYNEMKGAYSDPDRVLAEYSQRTLFPDTTYGVESGGHPHDIPNLTWEQFKGFHERFYHPSNARIWFYGDDPEEKRLAIANEFLKEFERRDVTDSRVQLQTPWDEPRSFTFGYDAGKEDLGKKYMATLAWMLPEIDSSSPELLLSLSVLNHILLGSSSSPLRKAMIDSGIGEDVVGGGLEMDLRQMSFCVGLKGMTQDGPAKMEKLIRQLIQEFSESGFSQERIDASINTIEFSLREKNTGGFPKGLSYMLSSMTTWLHESDPLVPLRYESPLAELKSRLAAKEPVFQELLKKYLIDNQHRCFVTLIPDSEYARKEEELERERVEQELRGKSQADLQEIVEISQRLKEKQAAPDRPEDLAKIPTLTKGELEKNIKTVPMEIGELSGSTILNHPLPTNGIIYMDLTFDFSGLSTQQLQLLSFLTSCLTELGTKRLSAVELQQEIGRTTGGIRSSTFVSQMVSADGKGPAVARFVVRGKAMKSRFPELVTLMSDVLLNVDLDNKERFRQLLIEEKSGLESSLAPSGHMVAASRLRAQFRISDWASEHMGGIEFLFFLRDLLKRVDSDWDTVARDLREVRAAVVKRQSTVCNITAPESDFREIRPTLVEFLNQMNSTTTQGIRSWTEDAGNELIVHNEGIIVPAQVNYVGKSANLIDLGYEPNGASSLAAKHLGTTYLWDRVRVQGGAYGGFCRLDARTGTFAFLSYRDPNVTKTIAAYDGAAKFLREIDLNEEELTKSIIGVIGDMDSYQLPDAKGFGSMLRWMTGEADEIRQVRREQVLSATKKDFIRLGEALEELNRCGSVVVVASEASLDQATSEGLDLPRKRVF